MENKDISQEELKEIIGSLPRNLMADDIGDFFTIAHHYAHKTPQSFRKVGGMSTHSVYCRVRFLSTHHF